MIISIGAENMFGKIPHTSMIKNTLAEILIPISLTLQINLGKTDIFTMLICPVQNIVYLFICLDLLWFIYSALHAWFSVYSFWYAFLSIYLRISFSLTVLCDIAFLILFSILLLVSRNSVDYSSLLELSGSPGVLTLI